MPLFALVHFNDIVSVYGQTLVRIDNDTKQARVGLKKRRKYTKSVKLHIIF